MKNSLFLKYLENHGIVGNNRKGNIPNLHIINIPENIAFIYKKIIKGISKKKNILF